MKRLQTFHEILIPLLVEVCDAESYLEFGTHENETIGKVRCKRRYGVDVKVEPCGGAEMYAMTTAEFIRDCARLCAPFDFVFIDACHDAKAVRDDFLGIIHHVSMNGIVCLHDTHPETVADTDPGLCGNAWRFARFLHESGYECVTLPYHPGLTILRKGGTWEPTC